MCGAALLLHCVAFSSALFISVISQRMGRKTPHSFFYKSSCRILCSQDGDGPRSYFQRFEECTLCCRFLKPTPLMVFHHSKQRPSINRRVTTCGIGVGGEHTPAWCVMTTNINSSTNTQGVCETYVVHVGTLSDELVRSHAPALLWLLYQYLQVKLSFVISHHLCELIFTASPLPSEPSSATTFPVQV